MISPTGPRRFTVAETREVMEVTPDSLDEVAAWCGGKTVRATVDDPPHCITFPTIGGDQGSDFAYVGDVVVREPYGSVIFAVPTETFDRLSTGWTEETT